LGDRPDAQTLGGALSLTVPAEGLKLDVRVDCPLIDFAAGNRGVLALPAPAKVTFRGRVKSTAQFFDSGEVRATFYFATRLCGVAMRQFPIGKAARPGAAATAGGVFVDRTRPAPKLTVEIRTAPENPLKLSWRTLASGLNPDDLPQVADEIVWLDNPPATL